MRDRRSNNTYVYETGGDPLGYCGGDANNNVCFTFRGGLFDQDRSSTFEVAEGDRPDTQEAGPILPGVDVINIASNLSLPGFPLDVNRGERFFQNGFGLGPQSTILKRLRDWGYIASRSYSFWYGLFGIQEADQIDGHLVFGGYDRSKVTGPNYTMPIQAQTSECDTGLLVSVQSVELEFFNGTRVDLVGGRGDNTFRSFCIITGIRQVQVPGPAFDRFVNMMGEPEEGTTGNEGGFIYPAGAA